MSKKTNRVEFSTDDCDRSWYWAWSRDLESGLELSD
jgi:hypothetical protein